MINNSCVYNINIVVKLIVRNLFILYNVLFLFAGNIFFSSIHHLNEHAHIDNESHECDECIILSNVNNFIADYQQVKIFEVETIQFLLHDYSTITDLVPLINPSRGPPIS